MKRHPSKVKAKTEYQKLLDRNARIIIKMAKAEISTERETLKTPNGVLRSAYEIAKRKGKDINWERWTRVLKTELDREHKIMYPKQYKVLRKAKK